MDDVQKLHDGHRLRLRQRVEKSGFEGMQPHEIIEFLLYYVIPRQDVNRIAHRLIERFGGVREVLLAETGALEAVEGVGRRTAQWLARVGENVLGCMRLEATDATRLTGFLELFLYACRILRELVPPGSVQLCLDMDSRLIYRREICPSRAWGEAETLRGALNDVLTTGARNALIVVFVGGLPAEADEYDIRHAADYAATMRAAGGALLDVLLVGDGGSFSLRQNRLMPDFERDAQARLLCEDYLRDAPDARALRVHDVRFDADGRPVWFR